MASNIVVRTEIHEFFGEFLWTIRRCCDHWSNPQVIKSSMIELVDPKSGKKLTCQAVIDSWKDFKVIGDEVISFTLHAVGETGEKILLHDVPDFMKYDGQYKSTIELHVNVHFAYCI